jgi:RNA polymerase sigma factor (sigma-70 family)
LDDRDEEVQRVLDAIDGLAEGESPAARAKQLTQLLDAMPGKQRDVRRARQDAVREMHQGGMTYREIGEQLGISFGRVRQILAHGQGAKKEPADGE